MSKLAEMRKRLAAERAAKEAAKNMPSGNSGSIFWPFWNNNLFPVGTSIKTRFLYDKNEGNPYWHVDYDSIHIPFTGTVTDPTAEVKVIVPCMERWKQDNGYGMRDPILQRTGPMARGGDAQEAAKAKQYWKKQEILVQGYVYNYELRDDVPNDSPIKLFKFGRMINPTVLEWLIDPATADERTVAKVMSFYGDYDPADPEQGHDFEISKSKGPHGNDYKVGYFPTKTAHSDDVKAAIAKYGTFDLLALQGKPLTDEQQRVRMEIFESSFADELFDPSRWPELDSMPFDVIIKTGGNNDSKPASQSRPAPQPVRQAAPKPASTQSTGILDDDDHLPTDAPTTPSSASPVNDILAKIKAKKQAS